MRELIERQAAIDAIDEWIKAFRENGHKESAADACLIQDGIIQLPSAQPERTGRWIVVNDTDWAGGVYCQCSVCRYGFSFAAYHEPDEWRYCPNCGAKMEVQDERMDTVQ